MAKPAVSKSQFHRFVRLQMSGRTNMYDTPVVTALVGITEDQYEQIRDNYEALEAEHGLPEEVTDG